MRFRDGTIRQKALFATLVGVYILGLLIAAADKLERVGQPDIGWVMDGANVVPTRWDAAAAGLYGGGRALRVNGVEARGVSVVRDFREALRTRMGDTNTLTFQQPGSVVTEISLPVRALEWRDVLFADGPTGALGALFVVVGVTSFLLRPYAASSWALLAFCCAIGGILPAQFLSIGPHETLEALYFRLMVGFVCCVPFHAGLAFPVVHPLLVRRPKILLLVYGLGLSLAALQFAAWTTDWAGPLQYVGGRLDSSVLLIAVSFFVGRCCVLGWRAHDALVAQRARIVLAGVLFGVMPVVVVLFLRSTFEVLVVDMRLAYWTLIVLLLALVYITVRQDLLNARIAVRRAVIYAAVVGVLTLLAMTLVSVSPYAVAALLLPLLYWWPHFSDRLSAWLYPKRARFPDLVRAIGEDMATSATIDAVLGLLARAPERVCDARSGVAFLIPEMGDTTEHLCAEGCTVGQGGRLADELPVQLMRTTRREISRDHIAVEPQYARIKEQCYACFDRLCAEVVLPILHDNRVVGALAMGPRASNDAYDAVDIGALSAVAQQAMQAIVRIEATERLRHREMEFADLKRFFPPQIIDQVMAKGGASELRSQRKLVTVLFADLRGFTSFSDSVEPEEVMATLAEYHEAMGQRIAEFGGTLERFAGDGFMVFFNDPVDQPDHVQRAVRMALAMRADMHGLREVWLRKGYQIDVGIGIHTGYATCGFVGYEGRRDYAVIGNVTNLTARLSSAATGGEILISARVRGELGDSYRTEPAGELTLKGFHQPQAAYRMLDADTRQRAAV